MWLEANRAYDMMQQQEHDLQNSVCQIDNKCYNEILVDTATYVANLPRAQAIFYLSTSSHYGMSSTRGWCTRHSSRRRA